MATNFKTELSKKLVELTAQREHWENGTYKAANAELHAILEECAQILLTLNEDKKNARAFNALAEELGVKFNKGTSLALKIVRLVFGQQNSREHAYAKVLKVWLDERDNEQTLTNFLIERGGVENVRRQSKTKKEAKLSADDYRDIAAQVLNGASDFGAFELESYMLSDKENDTDYMVALVKCESNGTGKIVYGSNKRALVNNALAVMGKEIDEQQVTEGSKTTLEEIKQKKATDMQKFVAKQREKQQAA